MYSITAGTKAQISVTAWRLNKSVCPTYMIYIIFQKFCVARAGKCSFIRWSWDSTQWWPISFPLKWHFHGDVSKECLISSQLRPDLKIQTPDIPRWSCPYNIKIMDGLEHKTSLHDRDDSELWIKEFGQIKGTLMYWNYGVVQTEICKKLKITCAVASVDIRSASCTGLYQVIRLNSGLQSFRGWWNCFGYEFSDLCKVLLWQLKLVMGANITNEVGKQAAAGQTFFNRCFIFWINVWSLF